MIMEYRFEVDDAVFEDGELSQLEQRMHITMKDVRYDYGKLIRYWPDDTEMNAFTKPDLGICYHFPDGSDLLFYDYRHIAPCLGIISAHAKNEKRAEHLVQDMAASIAHEGAGKEIDSNFMGNHRIFETNMQPVRYGKGVLFVPRRKVIIEIGIGPKPEEKESYKSELN